MLKGEQRSQRCVACSYLSPSCRCRVLWQVGLLIPTSLRLWQGQVRDLPLLQISPAGTAHWDNLMSLTNLYVLSTQRWSFSGPLAGPVNENITGGCEHWARHTLLGQGDSIYSLQGGVEGRQEGSGKSHDCIVSCPTPWQSTLSVCHLPFFTN